MGRCLFMRFINAKKKFRKFNYIIKGKSQGNYLLKLKQNEKLFIKIINKKKNSKILKIYFIFFK